MRRPLLAELAAARRGVVAVAATYSFFLLWAQYGFLHLLRERLAGPAPLRLAMGAMGVAGLLASLAAARLLAPRRPAPPHRADRGSTPTSDPARRLLVAGFLACAGVAPAALAARGAVALTLAAAAIGVATALVTVPLAADLRRLLPGERYGLAVGLGTGVAYLACNLPPLFAGTPTVQAVFVAAVCLAAASLTGRAPAPRTGHPEPPALLPRRAFRGAGFAAVVLAFLALVWLDSAAFAVIQETAPLKGASWAGAAHTLTQGAVHLLAAVAAGLALDAGGLMLLPPAAFLLFLVALPLLSGAPGAAGALLAAPLYAAGISLYSVALVAYPASRGDQAGLVPRRWRAGLLFGVAGWLGSALGVGMAQDLHRIPAAFLAAAAAVLAAALWLARGSRRGSTRAAAFPDGSAGAADVANGSAAEPAGGRARRVLRLVAAPVLFAAAGVAWAVVASPESGSLASLGPAAVEPVGGDAVGGDAAGGESAAIARGRRVYVGEGCVHCHSQYVRPASRDVVLWGPFRPLDRRQRPPLVGNRRQGPDLSNVGNRRSPEWQRLHLVDPRALVPGSRMPSYAHLYAAGDRRGADLVAYLASLGRGTGAERWRTVSAWPAAPLPPGSARHGSEVFARYCAACHGAGGRGDGPLSPAVRRRSMNLAKGPFVDVSWPAGRGAAARAELDRELDRLVRFGLAGSPMPGHEWLTPRQIADVVAYLHTLTGAAASRDGDGGTAR